MAIALAGVAVLASKNGMSLRSPSFFGDAVAITGAIGFASYIQCWVAKQQGSTTP
jgi:hypothetical protein